MEIWKTEHDSSPVVSTYHNGSSELAQHMDITLVSEAIKRPAFYVDCCALSRARVMTKCKTCPEL